MGRVIGWSWMVVWLGCLTVSASQLPADVLVDKYLLQATMLSEEKDHKGALEAMDRIVALQEEHNLTLPEDFPYRYAQTALAAGSVQAAIDSTNRYLSVVGREGKHYREALQLLVKAERKLQEPAPDPAASMPVKPDLELHPQPLPPSSAQVKKTTAAQPVVDCEKWNTVEYFQNAAAESVSACLKSGADPNARDEDNDTPLHLAAAFHKNPAVIEVLLKAGADPKARDDDKDTPLHLAARNNRNPGVIKALLKGGADARTNLKWTPLHEALVIKGEPGVIETLLKAGANPNARDKWKKTPLHYAVETYEEPRVIGTLLEAGADPKARDEDKWTPLHLAAANNENPVIIETLLDAGGKKQLKQRSNVGYMPLHYAAAFNKNPGVVKYLIDAGADLEATDQKLFAGYWVFHYTPLHMAARYNEIPDVIVTLLKSGADLHRSSGWHGSALHLAAAYAEEPAVVKALLDAGADLEKRQRTSDFRPLHVAAKHNKNPAIVETLLEAGADLEAELDPGGNASFFYDAIAQSTPLHEAASFGSPQVIETLLAAGADPTKKDDDQATMLHRAARYNNNPTALEILLKTGADLEARDDEGRTPLHLAAKYNENPKVLEALIRVGADLAALNEDGRTPLSLAKKHNDNPAIRQALLAAGAARAEKQIAAEKAQRKSQSGGGGWAALVAGVTGAAIGAAGGLDAGTATELGAAIGGSVLAGEAGGGSGTNTASGESSGNTGTAAAGGSCQVPGYPNPPGGVANLDFAWCPASVDLQVRAFALQAAGAQCAIAMGSSSTPEQIEARRREIREACDRLAALGQGNCQCPPDLQ